MIMGRNYVRSMSEAIVKYKPGDLQASAKIVENANWYTSLLAQHKGKEDNVLYRIGQHTYFKTETG